MRWCKEGISEVSNAPNGNVGRASLNAMASFYYISELLKRGAHWTEATQQPN